MKVKPWGFAEIYKEMIYNYGILGCIEESIFGK